MATLSYCHHGKESVRVTKVRRSPDGVQEISEFNVRIELEGGAERSFTHSDNSGIVATDTCKNTCYAVAKRIPCESPEEFGVALCRHFLTTYSHITAINVTICESPWVRASVNGQPHDHGFVRAHPELYTAAVKGTPERTQVVSGIDNLVVLKTTQSGFEDYINDQYTLLSPTRERLLATSIKAQWTYDSLPSDFVAARQNMRKCMLEAFFGPSKGGVYSPSVQATLWEMGQAVLAKEAGVLEIVLEMPNIHFLPAKLLDQMGMKFEDDVFVATSEPHGIIKAVIKRDHVKQWNLPSTTSNTPTTSSPIPATEDIHPDMHPWTASEGDSYKLKR